MPKIKSVRGLEILDSRGRPTVKAYVELDNGMVAAASVPSGASTGTSEAHELRDGDSRYGGLGCRKAVNNIDKYLNQALIGYNLTNQSDLDNKLIALDGTQNKSNLGANTLLAISMATARCLAKHQNTPLHQYFSTLSRSTLEFLPRPTVNLFSGGKHAGGQIPIQDLLIVPSQNTIQEVLECTNAIYRAASDLCLTKYQSRPLTADEGGLAPPFDNVNSMFEDALVAIENAGYIPGKEVNIALDVASTHFFKEGYYCLENQELGSNSMIEMLSDWVTKYPIISIEDGLAEEDWDHWPKLLQSIGSTCQILGDDLLCTNPVRIEKAVLNQAANALLVKVNQIGTITEALTALQIARKAGWQITVSARSGETEDDWLADLAVGWQANHIKIGSITQSERLSKYNRLLEIEQETGGVIGL